MKTMKPTKSVGMRDLPAPRHAGAPGRWRAALAAVAAAGVLAGCAGTPSAARNDGASGTREEPGLSVYGVVDVGVTRQRGR